MRVMILEENGKLLHDFDKVDESMVEQVKQAVYPCFDLMASIYK